MTYPREIRGQNFFALDAELRATLASLAPGQAAEWHSILSDFGGWVGGPVDEEAEYTDLYGPPVLEAYDRDGDIANRIVHNPAWNRISREVYEKGIVGANYGDDPKPFLLTFAMGYILSQADPSLHCPVTMTGALAHVIDKFAPEPVRGRYLNELIRRDGKALTGGTWATELHGGSDVGATTTVATPIADAPGEFRLNGFKWFTSNADGGLALATARPEGAPDGSRGLGIYLAPTHLDDGSLNPMVLRRLKNKLGTRGVPTGEIDLIDSWAVEVAPPPMGLKLMMEALEFSRIQNAIASVGIHRRAFLEAVSFAEHRTAFGQTITRYPMVQDEILDIMTTLEAGMTLSFAAAHQFDQAHDVDLDDNANPARAWLRMVTALAKYFTAEEAIDASRKAIEVIGGNGYVYDRITPRLLRDAQVLTVWEGPANIQALELLRLLGDRYPGFEIFVERVEGCLGRAGAGLRQAAGADIVAPVTAALADCRAAVDYLRADAGEAQRHARKLLALMADTLAAAFLIERAVERLETAGDRRKAIVARLFVERQFARPDRRGILPGQDWAQRHFDDLIHYRAII
ncbi:MAG: acyl-CoA dehydrogenase family protein [Sphingomonadales bacterium]